MGVAATIEIEKERDLSNPEKRHSPWATMAHLLTHIFIGSILFVAIAVPAIALNLWVHYLETLGVSWYIIWVITAVEYALITGDALLLLVLVGKSLYKAAKELEL